MNAHYDPVLFLAVTPSMRHRIEDIIEHLLALLDTLDGDPDLEDGGDAEMEPLEPYLADAASDLEYDPAESGIGDGDGLAEQWPNWQARVE